MDQDEVFILGALALVCGTIIAISLLKLIRSHLEARSRQRTAELPHHIEEQLETIRATVEATAIEVERVAEANRYLTRVLTESKDARVLTESKDRA